MADFNLRLCGMFIDVEAPALYDLPRRRSASALPRTGEKTVCDASDKDCSSGAVAWKSHYLAWLPQRAATLCCMESQGNGPFSRRSSDALTIDGPEAGLNMDIEGLCPLQLAQPNGPFSRRSSESLTIDEPEAVLNATEQLKSEFTNSTRTTQSDFEPDALGKPKHIQPMSRPHAAGQPNQMCAPFSPCMPEIQNDPPLDMPSPCEEITMIERFAKEITTVEPITTLMLCDLPCRLSIHEVVNVMNLQGFANAFDLIYMPLPKGLPKKKNLRRNLGYAFVNFTTPRHAKEFSEAFAVSNIPGGYSVKMCYTKPATRQGYDANWKEYSRQRKSVCCLSFRPTELGQ